ncbi:homeobox-leucine zipper protein ATHB-15 [Tanacetum coccineum]
MCYLGVELLKAAGEGSESILKSMWHHSDAIVCCSMKALDMLKTTPVALQDISLEKILDENGRKSFCNEFPQIMQHGYVCLDRILKNLLDRVSQLYYPFSLLERLKADNTVLNRSFSEPGDGVTYHTRRRHTPSSDGVTILMTTSARTDSNADLEDSFYDGVTAKT